MTLASVVLVKAERLFNSQGYVSTFAIRGDARVVERVEQRLDVQVVDEGEIWESFNGASNSLYTLLRLVSVIIAVAAVLGMMNMMFTITQVLIIINDGPYENERAYNALRLAMNLVRHVQAAVRLFLVGDGVARAHRRQRTPDGYCNVERMIRLLAKRGEVAA